MEINNHGRMDWKIMGTVKTRKDSSEWSLMSDKSKINQATMSPFRQGRLVHTI